MALTALITSQTAAATSSEFVVTSPTTVTCDGLGIDDVVQVLVKTVAGTFQQLNYKEPVLLTRRDNTIILSAIGAYQVKKGVTSAAVSVGYEA